MQFTPTVISAQPLEKAILEYLGRNDRVGLEHFLSTRRAPDIADIVDRLPEREQTEVFSLLPPSLQAIRDLRTQYVLAYNPTNKARDGVEDAGII
jgi:hypothetical protein